MISDIQIFKYQLHFHKSFKIAYEERSSAEIVIVKLVDENGHIGLGSAAPDQEVTEESIDCVLGTLQTKLQPDFFSDSIDGSYTYHHKIQNEFVGFPSAMAAVEGAVLTMWSKRNKISLSRYFGGYRNTCATMVTIGVQEQTQTLREIQERIQAGFRTIKIKCGINVEQELEMIRLVRKSIAPDITIILDANQGYSVDQAEYLIKSLRGLDIAFIEQPVAAADIAGLQKLHELGQVPVIADESVVSIEDARFLIRNNCVTGVNIKLMKCGGAINFIEIYHEAKKFGKMIMIGCMYESNISLTIGAHLSLGLPLDYIDLDSGHLDFYNDPCKGGMILHQATIIDITDLTI